VIHRYATSAMATRFELVLEGEDVSSLGAIAEQVFEEIRVCEESWSLFREGSLLSLVNREAAFRPVSLDEVTFQLLSTALEISRASVGFFDPTVAPLMRKLGLHSGRTTEEPRWGAGHVHLDSEARTVRFDTQGIALDLGGIAKGFALDLAADELRDSGVSCALLHGGTSSVVAIGSPPDLPGWQVALSPEPEAPRVRLEDTALAVSAPHGRTVVEGKNIRGHILDPRSGEAARGALLAAVIARNAAVADAWSTALVAAGEHELELPSGVAALRRFDSPGDSWSFSGTPDLSNRFFQMSGAIA
jgi:FAD:protein FMN transferase